MSFTLQERGKSSDVLVLAVAGSVTHLRAADLQREIEAMLAGQPLGLVLDLAQLRSIDATGFRVLLRLSQRLEARNLGLALAAPLAEVRRTLDVAMLTPLFLLHDTVDQAAAALSVHMHVQRTGQLALRILTLGDVRKDVRRTHSFGVAIVHPPALLERLAKGLAGGDLKKTSVYDDWT